MTFIAIFGNEDAYSPLFIPPWAGITTDHSSCRKRYRNNRPLTADPPGNTVNITWSRFSTTTSNSVKITVYRTEEHKSELQSLMRNSTTGFRFKKKNKHQPNTT